MYTSFMNYVVIAKHNMYLRSITQSWTRTEDPYFWFDGDGKMKKRYPGLQKRNGPSVNTLVHMYMDLGLRRRYQGQEQVIASHSICGM